MVRKLFILRHGEAESGIKWSDHERPLIRSGKDSVSLLSERLKRQNSSFDIIISSDAKRTQQTTQLLIQNDLGNPQVMYMPDLYNASLSKILEILNKLDNQCEQVLLVGHNPVLSELAAYLLGVQFISMAPGQIIACELALDNWAELSANTATMIEI